MKRSGRGRGSRERVEAARRQAALALGRDPDQRDPLIEPPKSGAPSTPKIAEGVSPPATSRGIGVLSIGEAAARLGMSRNQLEAMIDRGAVEALPTGYTRMIPTAEVERMQSTRWTP
jgi:excisionase family DNA binding protein